MQTNVHNHVTKFANTISLYRNYFMGKTHDGRRHKIYDPLEGLSNRKRSI